MLHPDGEGILNAAQRTAFERWLQRGKRPGRASTRPPTPTATGSGWRTCAAARCSSTTRAARTSSSRPRSNVETTPIPRPGCRTDWVRTDEWYNFTEEPRNVHVLPSSTRAPTTRRTARRRPTTTRSRGARTSTAAARSTPGSATTAPPGGAAVPRPHPGRRSSGPPGAPSPATAARRRRHPDRRVVRQGHARRQHREPDGDRDRAGRQRLLRRARRRGQVLQPRHRRGPRGRHDPGAPRQRERPARASRWTRTSPPTSGCTSSTARRPAGAEGSTSRASRWRPTATSTWPPRRCCCGSRTSGSSAATPRAR